MGWESKRLVPMHTMQSALRMSRMVVASIDLRVRASSLALLSSGKAVGSATLLDFITVRANFWSA